MTISLTTLKQKALAASKVGWGIDDDEAIHPQTILALINDLELAREALKDIIFISRQGGGDYEEVGCKALAQMKVGE